MAYTIGAGGDDSDPFFGRITEVSLHNVVRDASYIAAAAVPNDAVVQDSGDRVIVFDWLMSAASAGTVSIVEGRFSEPSHIGDGQTVYRETLGEGKHTFGYARAFSAASRPAFRIFVTNADGVASLTEDSALAAVSIPGIPRVAFPPLDVPLAPLNLFWATPIRNKVKLQWLPGVDERVTSVKIYFSTDANPVVDVNGDIILGNLLATADVHAGEYIHRGLTNGQAYYYTIVACDNQNHLSTSTSDSATPSDADDDTTDRPADVKAFRTEPVNATSVELAWEAAKEFVLPLTTRAYFDDVVYVYGMLIDDYGRPLTGLTNFGFQYQSASLLGQTSVDLTTFSNDGGFARGMLKLRRTQEVTWPQSARPA
jgi:hypothetical protein